MSDKPDLQQELEQFANTLELFRQLGLEYAHDPDSEIQQMVLASTFKLLVESIWAILRLQLEAAGQIRPQEPKDVVLAACDQSLVADPEIWLEALDYYRQLGQPDEPDATQNALDFSQTVFMEAVEKLAEGWGSGANQS